MPTRTVLRSVWFDGMDLGYQAALYKSCLAFTGCGKDRYYSKNKEDIYRLPSFSAD